MTYREKLKIHYHNAWKAESKEIAWSKGPMTQLDRDFKVLQFEPGEYHDMWIYATTGMSDLSFLDPIELHIFSSVPSDSIVEILTAVAYCHKNDIPLNLGHTVNFGIPWLNKSRCTFGLISLPYLDGPLLENFTIGNTIVKCFWLIPVTGLEVEYKNSKGLESLENEFEKGRFNYHDPNRQSVISQNYG
ncbi:MAG: suppressor of fused domain protein [Saprospiraceae bacterium]|nr:suppressor of fused domain protein [Saprospiraceae bacterium]